VATPRSQHQQPGQAPTAVKNNRIPINLKKAGRDDDGFNDGVDRLHPLAHAMNLPPKGGNLTAKRASINPMMAAQKIQKLWRGWQCRKQQLLGKLQTLKKIEGEAKKLMDMNREFLLLVDRDDITLPSILNLLEVCPGSCWPLSWILRTGW